MPCSAKNKQHVNLLYHEKKNMAKFPALFIDAMWLLLQKLYGSIEGFYSTFNQDM